MKPINFETDTFFSSTDLKGYLRPSLQRSQFPQRGKCLETPDWRQQITGRHVGRSPGKEQIHGAGEELRGDSSTREGIASQGMLGLPWATRHHMGPMGQECQSWARLGARQRLS